MLGILDNRKQELQRTLYLLRRYAMSFGEVLGSGPFFKASLVNLLPGQFAQPFIDAAFSDLGLDPNVLLPSQLVDPGIGQPGYPAAAGALSADRARRRAESDTARCDHRATRRSSCGPPGVALPGPGCYPYRPPPPAPPPAARHQGLLRIYSHRRSQHRSMCRRLTK